MNQAEIKRRQTEVFSTILTLIVLNVVARVTGENGAAYLVAAFEIYGLVWIFISGESSDTLGRLLRIRNAKGQYRNAVKMRKSVLLFQTIVGAAGSLFLFFFADELAEGIFHMQYATLILKVLAPVVFLRTISGVMLGFFQGEGAELPTAASVILRQIFILGFGLLFGKILGNYGWKVSRLLLQENFTSMYGSVGIAIAIVLTEVFIVLFLALIYKGTKRPRVKMQDDGMRFTDTYFGSVRVFCINRGVPMIIRLLSFLPLPLGLFLLQRNTREMDGNVLKYGAYLSGYVVVCGIMAGLIYMGILPMVSRVFSHIRKEEQRYAKAVLQTGTHIGIVHAAFCSVMVTVMASQTAAVVSPGPSAAVGIMFASGGFMILFLAAAFYFGKILMMSGKKLHLLAALSISNIVYAVSVTVFLKTGKMNVDALVYGGLLAVGILCVLLGILVYRQFHYRFDWLQLLVLPFGSVCVSGLVMMLMAKLLTPHMGNLVSVLVSAVIGAALYWVLLLVLRNFKEQETELIPGGRIINAVGQMLRVF